MRPRSRCNALILIMASASGGGCPKVWAMLEPGGSGLARRSDVRVAHTAKRLHHLHPRRTTMRFYQRQHPFYCGVDLHAKTMHVCIVDQARQIKVHKNLPTRPDYFLNAIGPYRQGLVVGVECMFSWYWLADLCAKENIPFVLGHALYMKAIHGGKTKND